MPEFLGDDQWRELDNRTPAGSLAVRRSLELHEMVDLEEVMYLLEALASMSLEDAVAAPFLERVQSKFSGLARSRLEFDGLRADAQQEREDLRERIYEECTEYNQENAWGAYSKFLRSLSVATKSNAVFVATTNYDRIIENLWQRETPGLHQTDHPLELLDGFHRTPYSPPILETQRGYAQDQEGESDGAVHLIKLHGSIGWREYDEGRVEDTGAWEYPGEHSVLAYPIRSDKSKEPPFDQLFERFEQCLAEANPVIIIGSSMRDRAVANRISDALQAGKKTAVIVDPKAETIRTKLSQKARGRAYPLETYFVDDWLPASTEEWEELFSMAGEFAREPAE